MKIRLGLRQSPLSIAQGNLLKNALKEHEVTFYPIVTSGDIKQVGRALRDKKDWILEIEDRLLEKEIDLALHSAKDVPIDIALGTELLPVLPRAEMADALITLKEAQTLGSLPKAARIGTSSLRRAAQIKNLRPDLEIIEIRGNVQSRLNKLENELEGVVLALAGLKRLEIKNYFVTELTDFIPCAAQGILLCQFATESVELKTILERIICENTKMQWCAEREVVKELNASCSSALGVLASIENDKLVLEAKVFSRDGKEILTSRLIGEKAFPELLGKEVAANLLRQGAKRLLG